MRAFHFIKVLALVLTAFTLYSCTNELPGNPADQKHDKIVLSINVPKNCDNGTRASAGLQMRYVAKLYKAKKLNEISASTYLQRVEVLANSGEPVVFDVEAGDYYVTLFADYISSDATADGNGSYPDCYYDTKSFHTKNVMKAIRDGGKNILPQNCNINNDNYDCFGSTVSFGQDDSNRERDITLKRIVSKVKVIASKGDVTLIESIKIKDFSFISDYGIVDNSGVAQQTYSESYMKSLDAFAPVDANQKILFYFYTFPTNGVSCRVGAISFAMSGKDGYEYEDGRIGADLIRPVSNTVMNVIGDFATPKSGTGPGTKSGIILHLDTDPNWGSENTNNIN